MKIDGESIYRGSTSWGAPIATVKGEYVHKGTTNLRFLTTAMWEGRESVPPTTQKITFATNPGDLIADLMQQASDATTIHAEAIAPGA